MKVSYNIREEDHVTYQLFGAAHSPRIQNQSKRSRRILTITYCIIGAVFLALGNYVLAGFFILFGVLWFLFYPSYLRSRYQKHYKAFVKENLSKRIGETISLHIANDQLHSTDQQGGSYVNITAIEKVTELKDLFFINVNNGVSVIVPKKSDKRVEGDVEQFIQLLTSQYKIPLEQYLEWEW